MTDQIKITVAGKEGIVHPLVLETIKDCMSKVERGAPFSFWLGVDKGKGKGTDKTGWFLLPTAREGIPQNTKIAFSKDGVYAMKRQDSFTAPFAVVDLEWGE